MAYGTIEAQIQTLLQGLTSIFVASAAVTRGDWRIVDGGYDAFAILYPGPFHQGDSLTSGGQEHIWTVNLELWKRFLNDGSTITTFESNRDAVLQHLQKYPSLNGLAGIQAVGNANGGEIIEVYDSSNNGPFFIYETIAIPIIELVTVTVAE